MPSWTTLTPLYEEDVLFALDAQALSRELDCTLAGTKGMSDLLTETEDNVSLMAYLRSVYPKDWECFKVSFREKKPLARFVGAPARLVGGVHGACLPCLPVCLPILPACPPCPPLLPLPHRSAWVTSWAASTCLPQLRATLLRAAPFMSWAFSCSCGRASGGSCLRARCVA
jgi:hypothetical protein